MLIYEVYVQHAVVSLVMDMAELVANHLISVSSVGLATHEPNFTIIREEFKPGKPRPCPICGQIGT